MTNSVGLVVPALDPDVPRLRRYLDDLQEAVDPTVIRIELDDPTGTYHDLGSRLDATVAITDRRRGKGKAITDGFESLTTDIRAFVDADGSTSPRSVDRLVEVCSTEADIAIASRHHPTSTVTGRSRVRRVMSRSFATFAGIATGIGVADFQCGAKAVTASAWDGLKADLTEAGFGWDLELLWLAAGRGYAIEEVPIEWAEKPGSTVPPLQTATELTSLAGEIGLARLRGHSTLNGSRRPLIEDGMTPGGGR